MTDLNPFQAAVLEGWPTSNASFSRHRDAASRKRALDDGSFIDARLSNLLRDLGGCTTPDEVSPIVQAAGDLAMAEIKDHLDRGEHPSDSLSLTARALREINAAIWNVPMPPTMTTC